MKRENINYLIATYIFKMGLTILLIVLSYLLLSKSTLSSYASTAEKYAYNHVDTQMTYVNNLQSSNMTLLDNKKILDSGLVKLHNPNKTKETVKLELLITKEIGNSINDLIILYDDNIIDVNYEEDESYYIIVLSEEMLEAYEEKSHTLVLLKSSNTVIKPFSYNFNLIDKEV